jgi:hypothetical protein
LYDAGGGGGYEDDEDAGGGGQSAVTGGGRQGYAHSAVYAPSAAEGRAPRRRSGVSAEKARRATGGRPLLRAIAVARAGESAEQTV